MPERPLSPGKLIGKLAEVRASGHWLQAIQLFMDALDSVLKTADNNANLLRCQLGPIFAEFLLPSLHRKSNQCPFIEAFRTHGRELMDSDCIVRWIGSIDDLFTNDQVISSKGSLLDKLQLVTARSECASRDRFLRGLELRLATILCLNEYTQDPRSLVERVVVLVKEYQDLWQTRVWEKAISDDERHRSVGWYRLHQHDPTLADKIQAAVSESRSSFRDPAVAFLVDTFCELTSFSISERSCCAECEDGGRWYPGDTYGLVVFENLLGIGIRGIVLRIRIERVRYHSAMNPATDVTGSLYPHPHMAAHFQVSDDFQEGIRNAWLTVTGSTPHQHDYRWSLIPVDDSKGLDDWFQGPIEFYKRNPADWPSLMPHPLRHQFLYVPLSGPSATLAFGLALKSVQPSVECTLRKDLIGSAAFRLPRNIAGQLDCKELIAQVPVLEPVGQIPKKSSVPELASLNISNLVVAAGQKIEQPLSPPLDQLIEVPNFDTAWKQFSTFEARIADFSLNVSKRWKEQVESIESGDFEAKQNDTDRLDRFVMPQLSWEIVHKHPARGEERYRLEEVEEVDLQQFLSIWKRLEEERTNSSKNRPRTSKYLFLYDTAGAGKSVVSIRFREQLCNSERVQAFFEDGLPRLVFRWIKAMPSTGVGKLIDQICADPDWSSTLSLTDRQATLRYALEQNRVVVIVDGLDEFSPDDQSLLMRILHPSAANRDLEVCKCQWVFTGRQHVIDEWLQDAEVFSDLNTLRLRILPFSEAKQDAYFEDLTKSGIDWRGTLADRNDQEQNELLSLPMNLREIRRLIEEAIEHGRAIPKFVSASDLFLQTARSLLRRALEKRTMEQREEDRRTNLKPTALLELLECVLGLVAFQMALECQWRSIQPLGASLSTTIQDVLDRARNRAKGNAERHWDWAISRLKTIALNNRATTEAFGDDYLAFQNRRVQEMYAAQFLTTYATEDDRRGASDSMCALDCNGDPAWESIWKATIKMPAGKIDMNRYRLAIQLLFERPTSSNQRRPTNLMWIADQWIKSQLLKGSTELRGFDGDLRNRLGEQFRKCLNCADEPIRSVAQSLIDPNYYKILADRDNPEYTEDEVEKFIPGFQTGKFKMGRAKVEVSLSNFGIAKYAATNEQFQLFDDNFATDRDYFSRFGGKQQPSVFVSWNDAYWFCEFVGYGAELEIANNKWRVVMPTDAQFEYAYRAGCQGDFFYARQGGNIIEVDFYSLNQFAHFGSGVTTDVTEKEPNAWQLRLSGNIWKWVFDSYDALRGGYNPVGAALSSLRVYRGGSWYSEAAYCESTDRDGNDPSGRWSGNGLVLALSPSGIPKSASRNDHSRT